MTDTITEPVVVTAVDVQLAWATDQGWTVWSRGKRHVAIDGEGTVHFLGGGADDPYWTPMRRQG
jgi:hypothetical protein